jgi:mercuric ion transport protein
MTTERLLKIGLIGTVITAFCCFTPLLSGLFALLGLSVLLGVIDYVLLPALAVFIFILFFALYKKYAS